MDGFDDLMHKAGFSSLRKLGAAAGISHETVRRVMTGRAVSNNTVNSVAAALGVRDSVLWGLRGDRAAAEPWSPPAASANLTPDERAAIARLILVLTRGRNRTGGQPPAVKDLTRGAVPGP